MIRKLDEDIAAKILIVISSSLIVFHVLIFFGMAPTPLNITWLGRVSTVWTMQLMTLLSIFLNGAIILCALVKRKYVSGDTLELLVARLFPFVYWWLVGNTVANLFAKTQFEVLFFTPILLVLTMCFYKLKTKTAIDA